MTWTDNFKKDTQRFGIKLSLYDSFMVLRKQWCPTVNNCQRVKSSEKIFLETKGVGMSDLSISYNHDSAPINQSSYPQFPLLCVLISLCASLINCYRPTTSQAFTKAFPLHEAGPLHIATVHVLQTHMEPLHLFSPLSLVLSLSKHHPLCLNHFSPCSPSSFLFLCHHQVCSVLFYW